MKYFGFLLSIFFVFSVNAQQVSREFDSKINGSVSVTNFYGKVSVSAEEAQGEKISLVIDSQRELTDRDLKIINKAGRLEVAINPQSTKSRVDLTLKVPLRSKVHIETRDGAVRIAGNLDSAEVMTETGTISTDIPLDSVKFNFTWNSSRPRYMSDVALPNEVKEKSGGRFVLDGKLGEAAEKKEKEKGGKGEGEKKDKEQATNGEESAGNDSEEKDEKKKKLTPAEKSLAEKTVELNFSTERGIFLLNLNPSEVPSNLQERPLTEAAKAIARSGDLILVEAIRRANPKAFGDYLKTLPPRKREPSLNENPNTINKISSQIKQVTVKVTDNNNRAIGGLVKSDFTVSESGQEREILKVEPTNAPVNLVLLLDVSGSVDNYVNFIRKAARNFISTVRADDKIAIIIFNEDIKQISTFTTDRSALSESLDTFDAGGGTAYYDSLAYTLLETLRPLRGERTAIVVMSDGDDNRSFLPFDALLGAIQESGALIYPLYVPSELIAASSSNDANASTDPLRSRFMGLTSKAESEGARLAQTSGGVYYPIRQLDDLQKAYSDIVVQLRTAYTVTFRSNSQIETTNNRAAPRLKVSVSRPDSFVNIGSVISVQ